MRKTNQSIKDYSSFSYWLETCEDDLSPRPSLDGSITVDVAILGAGFTGLWTAYYLLKRQPSLNIAILDREIAGFGSSGRNGGWCSSLFPVTPEVAIERFGTSGARDLQSAMFDSVHEVARVIKSENYCAHWTEGGSLEVAMHQQKMRILEAELSVYQKLGLDNHYQLLDKCETEQRVRIQGVCGSLFSRDSGVIHPGRLVRQLARSVENDGAAIYEQTDVLDFQEGGPSRPAKLVTRAGEVVARLAVVLAGEAYLSRLKKLHRQVVPIYSFIALTEPLTPEQWLGIGWEGRETVGSTHVSVNYLQRTADGRILFGGRGQPYRYASKIKDSYDRHKGTHETLQAKTRKWFPSISGIQFTHHWGGPLGVTRDWTPNFQFDARTKIACAWGYVGDGVATTNLAGRILCDLMTETQSAPINLPIVQQRSPRWEPEPFRFLGIRYVQRGLEKLDQACEEKRQNPLGNTRVERLSRH